jgi:hypothetical protein
MHPQAEPGHIQPAQRNVLHGWFPFVRVAASRGHAAACWMGVPSTLRVTWTLPRVALEYGHRWSARTIRSAASSNDRYGACRSRVTWRPKPPCPVGPIPTREWI